MSDPFLGEVRAVSFGYAPKGWATCDGQLLPINANQALFSLLGTTYGGDGRTTFALPDLRGRAAVHTGSATQLGQRGGEEAHTLSAAELPAHSHSLTASNQRASLDDPSGATWASAASGNMYAGAAAGAMAPTALATAGGGQPHNNMQPSLVVNYVIALVGIYPSRD